MRIVFLVVALAAGAAPAWAQQRTWTIARDIYSVDGELIAVRGDTAYLKIGDKVESIPLERLSTADHQFISTLALAPVTPGPTGDNRMAEPISGPIIPEPRGDILPVAAEQELVEHSLIVPASGTRGAVSTADAAIAEESLPGPVGSTASPTPTLVQPPQGTWSPQTGNPNARQNLQNNPNSQPNDSEANRRFWRQQQQQQQQRQQNNRNANSNRDDDDDDSRGRRGRLFGRDR